MEKHGVEGATLSGGSKEFRKYSVSKQPKARPRGGREAFIVMCVKGVDGALCGNLRQTSATRDVRCSQGSTVSRAGATNIGHGYVSCLPSLQQAIIQLVSMDNASRMDFYFT